MAVKAKEEKSEFLVEVVESYQINGFGHEIVKLSGSVKKDETFDLTTGNHLDGGGVIGAPSFLQFEDFDGGTRATVLKNTSDFVTTFLVIGRRK